MAKRNLHTKEELKEITLLAGRKIMAEQGLGKFSTRNLAKEIGYTVGTLYNIFEGYDDIILTINATTLDNMRDFLENEIKENKEGQKNIEGNNFNELSDLCRQDIEKLSDLYIQFATENLNSWLALFDFTTGKNSQLPAWYNEKMQVLFLLVEQPLKSLYGENSEKTAHLAKLLWASIHGICYLELTNKLEAIDAKSVQSMTHSLIYYFFKGINSDFENF